MEQRKLSFEITKHNGDWEQERGDTASWIFFLHKCTKIKLANMNKHPNSQENEGYKNDHVNKRSWTQTQRSQNIAK